MKSYLVTITEPWQTPAVVYEARRRAVQEPLQVLLEHAEAPNVVRGRFQPFEKHGVTEVRRPDGGLSWYHPKTFCLIRGERTSSPRSVALLQEQWGEFLKVLLSGHCYSAKNLVYRESDLYIRNGGPELHLIGMSAWVPGTNGDYVRVQRACWYESDPIRNIETLLRADNIDPVEFRKKFALVKRGFFAGLMQDFKAQQVHVYDFISQESIDGAELLQKKPGSDVRGSCIGGRTYT